MGQGGEGSQRAAHGGVTHSRVGGGAVMGGLGGPNVSSWPQQSTAEATRADPQRGQTGSRDHYP